MRRRHLLTYLSLALAITALGCEATGDEALERELEERARAQPPRAQISFGFIHSHSEIEAGGVGPVEARGGAEIEIEEAHLVVSAVEAHMCESAGAEAQGERGWLDHLDELLVPTARAHVPSSATRLGVPFVEDLLEEGRARIVGEIAPPLGRYCELYAVISPADDDVLNLSGLPTEEIEDHSFSLSGRWREDADADWQSFSSTSNARLAVELEAIDPNTGEHPLELDDPSQTKMMLLDKEISLDLFEGLDAESLEEKAADVVLDRLVDRLHIRVFENQ